MNLRPPLFESVDLPLASSGIAGFVSWCVLNRRDVRGDHAFVFFVALFGALHFTLLWSFPRATSSDILSTSLTMYAVYISSLVATTVSYRLSSFHPLAGFPGPIIWRISSLRLATSCFLGRRHLTIDDFHKKYGKFVRIGPNHLSINSPTAGSVIYSTGYLMEKSWSYNAPGYPGTVSLFFKQPRVNHAPRKRIWTAGFTGNAVSQYFGPLDRRTWQLTECIIRRKNEKGVVDLAECLAHWSYDFMGELVFGGCNDLELMKNGDPENLVNGGKMATAIVDSIGQCPWLLDILWHLPASKDIHKLQHASAKMMQNRIKSRDVDIQDLASYLLAGDPNTGDRISDADLEVEALVAVQAGSDNTATSMSLIFFYLLTHPPAYARLQAEIDTAFPDPTGPLDAAKLATLPYLNGIISEALRLCTPFFLPRIVPRGGVTVDGVHLPGETVVALASHSQQVSPDNFGPDAMEFRPERWSEDSAVNKSALVSFSSGPYVCIAKSFAVQEMRLVVSRLALTFDMCLAPGFDAVKFALGVRNMRTTVFDHPLLVTVERRPARNSN